MFLKKMRCFFNIFPVISTSKPMKMAKTEFRAVGWEELIDALDELETEVEYDGYFCSIQDAVIIVTLASMCELKTVMRIHSWATTETVSKFLAQAFGINNPDASVGVCCSHKVVAVGFNTLHYDASVGVLNPPHE